MQGVNSTLEKLCLEISPSGNLFTQLKFALTSISFNEELTSISLDSRNVNDSSIFIALGGSSKNGNDYIDDACNNGCKVVISQNNEAKLPSVSITSSKQAHAYVLIHTQNLSSKLGGIARAFYHYQDAVKLCAITGTNGKTSVANLYAQMCSLLSFPSASIGTLGVNKFTNGNVSLFNETINTTPDIVSTVTHLHQLSKHSVEHAAIEASSHGLTQDRLQSLVVDTAIFTNLSQDHLDYHGDMASYGEAKRLLLKADGLKNLVLNADDEESDKWQQSVNSDVDVYWYSVDKPEFFVEAKHKGCWVSEIDFTPKGSTFMLHSSWGHSPAKIALIGPFNIANVLASITALLAQQFEFDEIVKYIHLLSGVAGRMELFVSTKASILVDYAHTPDALKQALKAARKHTPGKLVCVFGCGGDRDTSKRPIMGSIACKYADETVLTQDNSRSEDPQIIINEILSGFASSKNVRIELEREQAIKMAWQNSCSKDMIVVAGKGHETYMELGDERITYNEREVVQSIINNGAKL
ncbi:UDP-N-acetylmuramoyl-L-alanyl-D-glutamate--2,6-diaminopimelate ligase [Glaciecola sp. 2405UD65-10]|uniref:UDP-N-acetylmuramoyl-L-alanyl-D-glutamate--2, 6-diaminopimelate ligase n=1 Tax=Glaciecola sp. 2405UD65-10 TaxID=3397244 RepID=UPI003B595221